MEYMLIKLEDYSFCNQIAVLLLISVDRNRIVLNSSKDYRPAARGYINASLIMVRAYISIFS